MIGQYLITFREVLEAALITSIILSYLVRTDRSGWTRYVWHGAYLAVAASVALGAAIWAAYGALPKAAKLLFESSAAFVAVAVLSSMIYWMAVRGRRIRGEVERRVEAAVSRGAVLGLVSISFIVVFREGLETVLFLTPFLVEEAAATLAGMAAGTATALALSYGVFVVGMRIDLRRFFYFTSVLLILLAGGLMGYGVHELLEYYEEVGMEAGWLAEKAFDLGIPRESPIHHKGVVGSIFAVMFGYTVSAEWGRVVAHAAYLAITLPLTVAAYRRKSSEILDS